MKKICIISMYCIFVTLFVSSCATVMPERDVVSNTFRSSFPVAEIEVDGSFQYLGNLTYENMGKTASGEPVRYGHDIYTFIIEEDKKIRKWISIQVQAVGTYYLSDLLSLYEEKIEHDVVSLGEKKYQCCTILIYPSASNRQVEYLLEAGYILPNSMLMKEFRRLEKKDTQLILSYLEDLSAYGADPNIWEIDTNDLTPLHTEYLQDFNENCMNSFKVSE